MNFFENIRVHGFRRLYDVDIRILSYLQTLRAGKMPKLDFMPYHGRIPIGGQPFVTLNGVTTPRLDQIGLLDAKIRLEQDEPKSKVSNRFAESVRCAKDGE